MSKPSKKQLSEKERQQRVQQILHSNEPMSLDDMALIRKEYLRLECQEAVSKRLDELTQEFLSKKKGQ